MKYEVEVTENNVYPYDKKTLKKTTLTVEAKNSFDAILEVKAIYEKFGLIDDDLSIVGFSIKCIAD